MSGAPAVTVEAKGDTKAALDLAELGRRGSDLTRVSSSVRNVVLTSNAKQFRRAPWKPLSDETVERKRRTGLSSRPEVATGRLERSMTGRTGPGQVNKATETKLRYGSKLFYAGWQSQGTLFQPARPLSKLSFTDREQIRQILGRYIAKGET